MDMPGRTDDHRWLQRHLSTMPRATGGDVKGPSTHEVAEITGIGQAAFKSGLHQARPCVRAAIGDQALVTAGG